MRQQEDSVREAPYEDDVEVRSRALVVDLVSELAASPSGVAFIATCLDRIVERHDLKAALAILDDEVLGLQMFNAGRRPLDLDQLPSALLRQGAGIHTDPTLPESVGELSAVAQLCDLALRLDRLRYESLHDPLTGLYNRRGFDEHLGAAVSRSVRYGWSFALVLLDLDGFKAINDRLGHQGGDLVLKDVGERLRHGLRSGDLAARVGGDEFALLVHLEGPSSVDVILDRLHGPGGFGAPVDVTWTAGLAMCPDQADTVEGLYREADRRLYEAKAPA